MHHPKHVLLYPMFLRCCLHLSDPFWKYIFEDLAYNKTPYGVVLNNDGLHSIVRHKEFSVMFDGKTDEQITTEICAHFSQKLSIMSHKDHVFQRNTCENAYEQIMKNITSWNDIKKKRIKDLLVEQYVLEMKRSYDLSMCLTRILYSIIYVGIQFKTITTKHVRCSAGKITSIEGISYTPRQIHCDPWVINYTTTSSLS